MSNPSAPNPKKVPYTHEKHGDRREDPYMWMHDRNNPELIEYLNAENQYVDAIMEPAKPLKDQIYAELKSRIKEEDMSVPVEMGGFYYYAKTVKDGEYAIVCRKQGHMEALEETIVDGNKESEGHPYFSMTSLKPSPNHKLAIYGVDTVGRRFYELRIMSLNERAILHRINDTTGNCCWSEDNKTVFYSTQNKDTLRSDTIWAYDTTTGQHEKIYHESDDTFYVSVSKSLNHKSIFIDIHATLTSEIRYFPSDKGPWKPEIFSPRQQGIEYGVEDNDENFLVLTNLKAKNFCVMEAPRTATSIDNWKIKIPHRDNVLVEGFDVFKDYLVLQELHGGMSKLQVIPKDSEAYYIEFDDPAYVVYPESNVHFETNEYRYAYESMTTPASILSHKFASKTNHELKQKDVPGYDKSLYKSERFFVEARDGAKVPVLMVYRGDKKLPEGNPTLLYGYGSYGATMDPYFSTNRVSLLDRGFVFAMAQIRGGSELGRKWYEDGRQLKKMNTFNDFIDCGDHLINSKVTASGRLFAMGGSAGGLLVGAVINERPDLFCGVVAEVPFVDVVTTMLDESIPLTTGEYDEWGNPNEKTFYDYMKSYSPYDNVAEKNYPHILVTSGLHDSQVQYWEPTKWVAKLRDKNQSANVILLKTNMTAGHGGASGRYQVLEEVALIYTFILHFCGDPSLRSG